MGNRLSNNTLGELPADVSRPAYDRSRLQTGIVHLGVGAFHRAHQAVYTDAVLNGGDLRWGIVGASLRSAETRDALAPQDGLYTVAARDGAGEQLSVVGSSTGLVVAPEDPEALLTAMTRPEMKIVSLTVTEKGYCHSPSSGDLDETHPDIRHDLASPRAPRSAIGFIVEAIARRRSAGHAPFTLLSCDNLPANGRTLKRAATRFAELRDHDLGRFVAEQIACPSTMVDRIVPATTDADRAAIAERLGLYDAWPIMTEPFSQWVIEDDFPAGRPEWEQAGATFVRDVDAYELMKLRLLNGSHSTLAYLGYLAGHETVAEAIAAPGFGALIQGFMDEEVTPTLPDLPGIDLATYKADLFERFRNPALRHRTWQIAMDGSQKLPQRLLNTIRDRIGSGAPFARLALGVAAWMRYTLGRDEKGAPIDVRDPLAELIRSRTQGHASAADLTTAFLGLEQVFGTDLPSRPEFRASVETGLDLLLREGAAAAVARFRAPYPRLRRN
ncbi:mannitol dehydrogenase family protein [Pseudaminobacter sp. 19-2017]|uniref:Mannitol dehydrogenase family protein n=1 Tax=Pseudaminobacter soli (ex Zhang et al. 2022) TaxID=2831468 RepID=A0A942DXS9_9HYPH|nr:mannitol dehydrogenase family protein [Pseudaminobacter soli]MBS3647348.1 mannitol dehydrogenase family protein [Pseudaminobacter soli]